MRNKSTVQVGEKFNFLTILEIVAPGDGYRYYRYRCLCDCGNTAISCAKSVRQGKTKSCGCLKKKNTILMGKSNRLQTGNSIENIIIDRYKYSARVANREFTLTKEECQSLLRDNCHYCSKEPCKVTKTAHVGDYSANGIDRVDNTKGYIQGNVVTCCKRCNAAKMDMSVEEFKQLITNIYHNYILKEAIEEKLKKT